MTNILIFFLKQKYFGQKIFSSLFSLFRVILPSPLCSQPKITSLSMSECPNLKF